MGAFRTGAILGFGIGYMQGAKAGRQRYEQIQLKMKKVADSPTVKKAIEPIKPMVNDKLESGKEMVGSMMNKASGNKSGSGSSGKPGASQSTVATATSGAATSNTGPGSSNPGA